MSDLEASESQLWQVYWERYDTPHLNTGHPHTTEERMFSVLALWALQTGCVFIIGVPLCTIWWSVVSLPLPQHLILYVARTMFPAIATHLLQGKKPCRLGVVYLTFLRSSQGFCDIFLCQSIITLCELLKSKYK